MSMTPPPPPGFGGPGYGQPGYGYGYQPDHPQGTTVLVLGILSLVLCPLLGPVAWTMGNTALREIDAVGGGAPNRGQVAAGRVCGIIASVLFGCALAVYLFVFIIIGAALVGSS